KGKITGNEKPLELATIVITGNSIAPVTLLSDSAGFFETTVPAGNYHIEVSLIGYKTYSQDITTSANLLLIVLERDEKMLQTVTLQTKKPLVERKLDRIIFYLQNSITASSGTAWDALGKAPGVRATMDGSITVNGKSAVIYLDDRLLRLSGEDLSNFLKNYPAENIIRIEVIPNPSARYDAQGGAVIHLVTKKILTGGLNATLTGAYTQATYGSYRSGLNFNYRHGKWNFYGNYGYNRTRKAYRETDFILFEAPGSYAYWDGRKNGWRKSSSHTYKAGVDYTIGRNKTIGFLIDGTNSTRDRDTRVQTVIYNGYNSMLDSFLKTSNYTKGTASQYAFNLNYKGTLDTAGKKSLNMDFDYAPFKSKRIQDVLNSSYLPDGSLLPAVFDINSNALQDITIFSGRLDYARPLDEKWTMEAGVKYSSISSRNTLFFYNKNGNNSVLDPAKSNAFNYLEKISALYASFTGSWKSIAIQAGLRGEYTRTSGNSVTLQSITRNNYFRLFPTLFADYTFSPDHQLSLYYGQRISRPDYWRLNPFRFYSSPYTYLEGNPYLQPARIREIELGYTFRKQYSINLFYRNTRDYFSNITVQDNEKKIFYDTQQNLEKSMETGVYCSAPWSPWTWWEMNYFVQASYKQEKSGYLGGSYDYSTFFLYGSATESFILSSKHGWKAELTAWYASRGIQGIYKLGSNFDVSFGVRKTISKGKGSLQLSVADIFYSNYYRIRVNYLNQRNGFNERSDTRSVTLNFSYNLGQKKIASARKRNTSNEEEKKRARN
ncbi:MAG: outer membrane beta-barrel family protein, partial [Chitinophagaceae bacterium]